jgi:predicted LPLAT superfamily acyltransferase
MSDPCSKSREIDDIKKDITKIEECIDGNGRPGIKSELVMIRDEQKHMNQIMAALNTNVAALLIFQAEIKTVTKIKLQIRDIVNMIITAVISASAIATAFIAVH